MLDSQKNNLRRIAQAAASEQSTGCPAELITAQCILESGWLTHAPGNNCFGIKSYAGEFGRQLLRTREWFTDAERARFLALAPGRTADFVQPLRQDLHGRKLFSVQDWFATFATLADCFARRAAMFNTGRYAPFAETYKANLDLEALVRGISPIYATDPTYADTVWSLIRSPEVQAATDQAQAEVDFERAVTHE